MGALEVIVRWVYSSKDGLHVRHLVCRDRAGQVRIGGDEAEAELDVVF